MALTTAEIVRLRLNDPWQYASEVHFGDSTGSGFRLIQGAPHSCTISGVASVVNGGWSATAVAWDTARGYVTFFEAVPANTAVRFDYHWAVFSDDDMAYFTAQGGVIDAVIAGVETLMSNAWKRARWAAPDGSQYDDSKAMDNLMKLRAAMTAKKFEEVGPAGGLASWAEGQGDYG
jgi:hypothetical protein